MTEREWLASDDPAAMLRWLIAPNGIDGEQVGDDPRVIDRELRLFACAASRAVRMPTAERLAAVEAWADGGPEPRRATFTYELRDAALAAGRCAEDPYGLAHAGGDAPPNVAHFRRVKAAILRDIVGDPFRPVDLFALGDRATRPWCDAVAVAWGAYAERLPSGALDPARLLVLADALDDAGCEDAAALSHLRRAGNLCPASYAHPAHDACDGSPAGARPACHRGCWVVDAVLSKR